MARPSLARNAPARQPKKPIRFYAGFCDGELHLWCPSLRGSLRAEVFTSRAAAKREYEDVREVRIVEVEPPTWSPR